MKTVLITGANRGIGLELCGQLKERGAQVIAVCRQSSSELDALGVRMEAGVELTSEAAVAGCVPWSGVKAEACDLIGDQ